MVICTAWWLCMALPACIWQRMANLHEMLRKVYTRPVNRLQGYNLSYIQSIMASFVDIWQNDPRFLWWGNCWTCPIKPGNHRRRVFVRGRFCSRTRRFLLSEVPFLFLLFVWMHCIIDYKLMHFKNEPSDACPGCMSKWSNRPNHRPSQSTEKCTTNHWFRRDSISLNLRFNNRTSISSSVLLIC